MLDRYYYESMAAAAAASSTTFSLFFPPLPNKVQYWADEVAAADDEHSSVVTTSPSSPSSSTDSVDCTLSLWTPSSRRAAESVIALELTDNDKHVAPHPSSAVSSWDVDVVADHHYHSRQQQQQLQGGMCKPARGSAKLAVVGCAADNASSVDRRCANCGTSSTPLWRNGPRGPKSLCNACGIRFKKEERRAAAMENVGGAAAVGCGYSAQRAQYEYGTAAAVQYEVPFPCGGRGDPDASAPFLAWRPLNVVAPAPAPAFDAVWPERTSLYHYN